MGEWADDALKKFQDTSSKTRLDEELELVRHYKTVAAAQKQWVVLVDFIKTETSDFNRKKERAFFAVSGSGNEIEVAAPELRLKLELDLRTPTLDFTNLEPFPNREEKTLASTVFGSKTTRCSWLVGTTAKRPCP
jgi:hypothetical protein